MDHNDRLGESYGADAPEIHYFNILEVRRAEKGKTLLRRNLSASANSNIFALFWNLDVRVITLLMIGYVPFSTGAITRGRDANNRELSWVRLTLADMRRNHI